ncbi:MAG: response regulator, partial [Cyclobacteriaceae bacterium]
FNQVAELSNQIIFHITSDIHNNLWINSSSGIIQYFPQENKILNYNQEAGLTPMIHNIFSTPDGELVILDEKGFYCFNPDSIKGNQHIPPVYFSRININGREIPLASELFQGKNLNTIDRLVLTHEQKVIKIKFDVLNYTLPEKNLYAYKLEGYDTAWIQMGHNNEITLMNLNPGNYTLRVKGANNDNLWNETGKSIKIKVKPPVYKTTYAYLLYILIITGIVVLRQIYQKNRNKLKLKYERQQLEAIKKYELEKLTIQKEHEMDQLKLKFFFDISHEFRTPLTLILAPISTIIKENKFPRLKESHEIIHKNAIHLKNLIDQLLDLRKLEAGKMPPVLVKEKPGLFLNGLKNAFLDYANNRQIVLKTNFQLAESYYNFDKDKIQKIISNLLSNALKFSGNGSEILFSAKILDFESYSQLHQKVQINMKSIIKSINPGKEDQILYINIEDHGKGIPEQDLEKIFLRFYQVPNNFSKPTGTGIGLSLCRELVELLNGSLYIKSQLGMGTLVSLFLPLVPYDGSEQEPIIDTAENQGKNSISNSRVVANKNEEDVNTLNGERKNKKPLILIVEDNEDLLKYLGSFLSEKFLVKKAVNGDEGFVKAQKYIPDLIISDIMMPLVNGYEFCRRIKSEKHLQHIPLIILTAKTGDESVKEFLELGVDDYLVKPFQSEMLQTRIDNLLKKHNQLKTAFKGTSENLPGGITLVNRDEEFIQKAVDLINENLTNADFDKDAFAREMGVSRSQLYKRIIALTGESPNEFVRNIKLKKAAQILKTGTTLQISEIGYMVGFTDPNYFTRKFREYFGTPPREYIMEQKEKE